MEGETGGHGFKCDHNEIFYNRGLFFLFLSLSVFKVTKEALCRATIFITSLLIVYLCLVLPQNCHQNMKTTSGIAQQCWGVNNNTTELYFLAAQN